MPGGPWELLMAQVLFGRRGRARCGMARVADPLDSALRAA